MVRKPPRNSYCPVEVLPAACPAQTGDGVLQGVPDSPANEQQRADVLRILALSSNQGQDLGDLHRQQETVTAAGRGQLGGWVNTAARVGDFGDSSICACMRHSPGNRLACLVQMVVVRLLHPLNVCVRHGLLEVKDYNDVREALGGSVGRQLEKKAGIDSSKNPDDQTARV